MKELQIEEENDLEDDDIITITIPSISNSSQRESTLSVQFIQFDNRINNYKKKVTFKNSRLTFKLEETHNYDV